MRRLSAIWRSQKKMLRPCQLKPRIFSSAVTNVSLRISSACARSPIRGRITDENKASACAARTRSSAARSPAWARATACRSSSSRVASASGITHLLTHENAVGLHTLEQTALASVYRLMATRVCVCAMLLSLRAGAVSPEVDGPDGQRAFDDLAQLYGAQREPPWQTALDQLRDGKPEVRAHAGKYLYALLAQALADDRNGRAAREALPFW